VITWNMGMGPGPNRGRTPGLHDQAWHFLLGLGPDLAFVQEALPPAWVRAQGTLVHGPFQQWGSAIFSPRYPLERYHLPEGHHLRTLGTYLALARAMLPDGTEAVVASVHARAGKASVAQLGILNPVEIQRSSDGPNVNDVIFAGLADLVGDHFIVAGDWNTARHQASDPADKRNAIGRAFFKRASDRGWFDCTSDTPGAEFRTWFGPGIIVQDDYVFCDQTLKDILVVDRADPARGPWASKDVQRLRLSDHAPLVLDFKMESIAMKNLE
jgi:endonuclease/exonuclease/phosphatase (EEP) superfamily protein YafD